jgi:hypothetical protein
MTSIIIKLKPQRSPGSSRHAVEATHDLLDGFVAARQHGTGRTLFIMLMLHVFMASRITLDQSTELQYRFCALGFIAYIVVDGGVSHKCPGKALSRPTHVEKRNLSDLH